MDLLLNISPQGYSRDISARGMTNSDFFRVSAAALAKSRWRSKIEGGSRVLARDALVRFIFAYEDAKYRTEKI